MKLVEPAKSFRAKCILLDNMRIGKRTDVYMQQRYSLNISVISVPFFKQ